jgi:hypothetical protein
MIHVHLQKYSSHKTQPVISALGWQRRRKFPILVAAAVAVREVEKWIKQNIFI